MKTLLFIIILFCFLNCEKETEKEKCWTCTETWSGHYHGSKSWEVCNVLDATKLDGRRILKYTNVGNARAVTVYLTNCSK
jgi:hypothetical protein